MKKEEEIIEQRKQFPRMFVSDNGVTWVRRILLLENIDGSCITVDKNWKKEFLNGENFHISSWFYRKPLPEIKQVPFSHGREIDFDWFFRSKITNIIYTIYSISASTIWFTKSTISQDFNCLASEFELSKDGGQTWGYAGKEVEE